MNLSSSEASVGSQSLYSTSIAGLTRACYGTHLYCCTIRVERLVNNYNGGNHTGTYSYIYIYVDFLVIYRELIRKANL